MLLPSEATAGTGGDSSGPQELKQEQRVQPLLLLSDPVVVPAPVERHDGDRHGDDGAVPPQHNDDAAACSVVAPPPLPLPSPSSAAVDASPPEGPYLSPDPDMEGSVAAALVSVGAGAADAASTVAACSDAYVGQ